MLFTVLTTLIGPGGGGAASAGHLLAVIDNVLDFSRIQAGRLKLERVDFSVHEVLENVRSLMAPQALERGPCRAFERSLKP
jgi:signal transduction histidine kinase